MALSNGKRSPGQGEHGVGHDVSHTVAQLMQLAMPQAVLWAVGVQRAHLCDVKVLEALGMRLQMWWDLKVVGEMVHAAVPAT